MPLIPDELVWCHTTRTGVARAPLRRGETLQNYPVPSPERRTDLDLKA
jgi:hypothetical protein